MMSRKDPLASEAEPWLVFCYGDDIAGQTFYNVSEDSYYIMSISDMLQKGICTGSHGWVVILDTKQGQCFLLYPFTLEKIHLPPREWKSFKYNECLLSSSPHDPNCIVMFTYCDETRLLLCRVGDERWFTFNMLNTVGNFYSPVICNGTIYGLDTNDRLLRFETGHAGPIRSIKIKYLQAVPHLESDSMGANLVGFYDWNLVGFSNELFLVHKYHLTRRTGTMVWSFQIFKMDFSRKKWQIVRNLGNKALFIDPKTKGVFYSTTTGSSSSSRILRNSIYFTQKEDRYLYRFDMKERSISSALPCPHLNDKMANSVWVMPDAVQSAKMFQMMKMHMQGQNKALDEKEKDILEDSKKGDYFPISSKVVTKYSYLAPIVGALMRLLIVLFVRKNKMKLGLVIAAASTGALLVMSLVIR
ncbi:uncharacterized protein LOC122065747 [Macadamia integrifolia]|uniref:uncharacterized protein LOC122065747 n=1 Tax=Macadamia integrifolia TaxID=60698 RepID=UPI001C4E7E58|nr:uncharacterized protein LOC122065747 [Macadamia integrifolia]XP_042485534.1 uncharacterized protein LOC122065747 [Macadamia integrifolia]XP_042485535.1 uncharacterized protein LOC122065747 [Macadamia integrifolia]XP_042485536.1 uncharacterized protein LOC122065747 [Macadamia integrifolia]